MTNMLDALPFYVLASPYVPPGQIIVMTSSDLWLEAVEKHKTVALSDDELVERIINEMLYAMDQSERISDALDAVLRIVNLQPGDLPSVDWGKLARGGS